MSGTKSQPGHIIATMFVVFFNPCPYGQMPFWYLKLSHNHILPHALHFTMYPTIEHYLNRANDNAATEIINKWTGKLMYK